MSAATGRDRGDGAQAGCIQEPACQHGELRRRDTPCGPLDRHQGKPIVQRVWRVARVGDPGVTVLLADGRALDRVARHAHLSTSEVVALHASLDYLVFCIGFAPGFSYCGGLPAALETPRRPSPRARVPAGSVGVAGRQTGIYAVESPGGWNLLGRTDRILFDPGRERPCALAAGDRVRFTPVAC